MRIVLVKETPLPIGAQVALGVVNEDKYEARKSRVIASGSAESDIGKTAYVNFGSIVS